MDNVRLARIRRAVLVASSDKWLPSSRHALTLRRRQAALELATKERRRVSP